MKIDPDRVRPGDPGARPDSVRIAQLRVITVVDGAVFHAVPESCRAEDLKGPSTLTERVLAFLNGRAA